VIGLAFSTARRKPGPSVADLRRVAGGRSPRAASLILTASYSTIRMQQVCFAAWEDVANVV